MLAVPVGTVVKDADGDVLVDMTSPGMRYRRRPRRHRRPRQRGARNPKRKAPGFALLGTPGLEGDVLLELKTVADVALVGYPSAGKSSLIAALLGRAAQDRRLPVHDAAPEPRRRPGGRDPLHGRRRPGLIEGASEGKGLGLEFLRHVERCTALLHVLDCATLEPGRDPLSDLDVILAELAAYPVPEGQVPLLERPQLIALNKVDVPEAASSPSSCAPTSRRAATACSRSRR